MKTIITFAFLFLAAHANAVTTTTFSGSKVGRDQGTMALTGYLVNEAGLTYSNSYVLDAGPYDRISAQVNYGSTTYSTATFSDGKEGAGKLTFLSTTALSGVQVQIGRYVFVAGTDYNIGATPTATAANFVSSIPATGLFPNTTFSATGAVVYATATLNGVLHDHMITSGNSAKISVSPMTGAIDPAFALNSPIINIPSHGFTLGLPVLYTANSATIGGLTSGVTYYAIPVDVNNIELATTSARAVAGQFLVVTSTTNSATAHSPTLAPVAISGSPAFTWSVSNDGTNYAVYSSSGGVAFSVSGAAATGIVDFGSLDYRYLKMSVTGPTNGGIKLQTIIHAKMGN